MANSLFSQLNQPSKNDNIMQMVQELKASKNPQEYVMELARRDDKVASILQDIQKNGGDARSLFFQRVKQMGISPLSIINQLK